MPWGEALDNAGVRGRLRNGVLEPFLAGVLAEDGQETSRVFVDLLIRTFVRGIPALPARGMQALPDQLAKRLPTDVIRLESPVDDVTGGLVRTPAGDFRARAVVVATDGPQSARLTGLPVPPVRGLTTYYHQVATSPAQRKMLHIDGERRRPGRQHRRCLRHRAVVLHPRCTCRHDGPGRARGLAHRTFHARATRIHLPRRHQRVEPRRGVPDRVRSSAMVPPLDLRQPVDLGRGLFVCGDHRDTASIQGAIVSGRRTAVAVQRSWGREVEHTHRTTTPSRVTTYNALTR